MAAGSAGTGSINLHLRPCCLLRQVLEEGKNHASTMLGTPYYLSPEICQVSTARRTGRCGCSQVCQPHDTNWLRQPQPLAFLPLAAGETL